MKKLVCQICGKHYEDFNGLSRHLSKEHENMTKQDYYDKFLIKNQSEKICLFCNGETKFFKINVGYYKTCSSKHCKGKINSLNWNNKTEKELLEINQKRIEASMKKYGCENPAQSDSVKQKMKHTNLIKFGFEYAIQSKEIQKKVEQTCLKVFGFTSPAKSEKIQDKMKQTNLKNCGFEFSLQSPEVIEKGRRSMKQRLGVENCSQSQKIKDEKIKTNLKNCGFEYALQSPIIQQKSKQTSLKNWGTEHPMQNSIVLNKAIKNSFKSKEYTLPSGKTVQVQGYENYVLDELFSLGYKESDLIIQQRKEMPKIYYFTDDGVRHRYFPDIFIPKENLIIEVKSSWTFEGRDYLKENILKSQACLDAGYKFIFKIIYKPKRIKCQNIIK